MTHLTLHSTMGEAHTYADELVEYAYTQLHTMDRMQDGPARDAAHTRLCEAISQRISGASDALGVCMIADPSTLAAARAITVMGGKVPKDREALEGPELEAAVNELVRLGEAKLSVQLYMTAALCCVMIAEMRLAEETTPQVTTPESQGGTEGDPLGVQGE